MWVPRPFPVNAPERRMALPPSPGVRLSGSLQPAGRFVLGLMVRLTVLECVRLLLVPVMVNVNVPVDAVLVVEMLKVDEPEPLIEVGLNVALAPVGTPLTLQLTFPRKHRKTD